MFSSRTNQTRKKICRNRLSKMQPFTRIIVFKENKKKKVNHKVQLYMYIYSYAHLKQLGRYWIPIFRHMERDWKSRARSHQQLLVTGLIKTIQRTSLLVGSQWTIVQVDKYLLLDGQITTTGINRSRSSGLVGARRRGGGGGCQGSTHGVWPRPRAYITRDGRRNRFM